MKTDPIEFSFGLRLVLDSSCLEDEDLTEIYEEISLNESEEYVFLHGKNRA
jgi:hypothetical protein